MHSRDRGKVSNVPQVRQVLQVLRAAWVIVVMVLASATDAAAQTTAVRFARLWDGEQVIDKAVVIVEGDRIVRVTTGRDIPAGATVIDLSKYTGVPGLIDAHTHITYYWDRSPGTRPREQRKPPAVTVFLAQENARRTLETGVTTVRDLNAANDMDFAMRELTRSGAMIGPRIFASGQGISARQGSAGDPAAMRKLVEDRVKAGADWIKVFGSRGGFESVDGTQTVTFEQMKAVVDAARALGKKVAIHSYGPSGVRDAVWAGADSIEHGADLDDETIGEMARRGTVWVPTVDHNRYYIDAKDEYGFAPGSEIALKNYIDRNLESLRRAVKAGVRIAMGSDAVYSMFGQNTRELEWFVKAGMTPAQALSSATIVPATLLDMQKDLGRLAPGYFADLVAVEGDPLQRIDALFTGVRWVMKSGKVVVDRRHARPNGAVGGAAAPHGGM
jgi:imidazolonepropionase-like amidohydrolase